MKWHGEGGMEHVNHEAGRRVDAAARWLRDRIREAVSIPNVVSVKSLLSRFGRRRTVVAGRGKNPSEPGEYPRKRSGHFRRNVQSEYDPATTTARVGTNVIYGKYLETGTRKMKPRPWLSNALRDFIGGVRAILEGGPAA